MAHRGFLGVLPRNLLRNTSTRPTQGAIGCTPSHFIVPTLCMGMQPVNHKCYQLARTDSPVRRVSGIGVQGVERQGCRERRKGPRTALVRRPLERRCSERTRNAAKRSDGPYAGGPSFAYFSWANKKSEAPFKAQSIGPDEESAKPQSCSNGCQEKATDCQSTIQQTHETLESCGVAPSTRQRPSITLGLPLQWRHPADWSRCN